MTGMHCLQPNRFGTNDVIDTLFETSLGDLCSSDNVLEIILFYQTGREKCYRL